MQPGSVLPHSAEIQQEQEQEVKPKLSSHLEVSVMDCGPTG